MILFGGAGPMQAMNTSLKMNRAYRRLKKNIYARNKDNPISEEGELTIDALSAQAKNKIKTKVIQAERKKHRMSMASLGVIAIAVLYVFIWMIS